MVPNRLPAASLESKCTGLRSPVIAAKSSMSCNSTFRLRRAMSPTFISGHLPFVEPPAGIDESLRRPPSAVFLRTEKRYQLVCLGAVRGQSGELPVKDLVTAIHHEGELRRRV